jgi:hypothetical protein
MEYDENDAIEFIVKKIGIEIEEDEILNIIDIIWDYYEDNGMLDISMDNDEDESDITTLIAHVVKIVSKDKSLLKSPASASSKAPGRNFSLKPHPILRESSLYLTAYPTRNLFPSFSLISGLKFNWNSLISFSLLIVFNF